MTAATLGWSARLVMLAAATVLAVWTVPTTLRSTWTDYDGNAFSVDSSGGVGYGWNITNSYGSPYTVYGSPGSEYACPVGSDGSVDGFTWNVRYNSYGILLSVRLRRTRLLRCVVCEVGWCRGRQPCA